MAGTVTANVFTHWIRELNIVRYGDERPVLPTTNTVNVYRYSDGLLKYMLRRIDYNGKQFTLL